MKNVRKSVAVVMMAVLLCMVTVLTGCGPKGLSGDVKIGTLVGPTGMGLVDLMDDEAVDVELYQSPTDVTQKLLSGDLDVVCVPSNLGAVLYAKTGGNVQVLTTVVNGVLYIVENGDTVNDVADLKGKTIIGSGQGGTPEYVLDAVLESEGLEIGKDVEVKWLENHADVAQKVAMTPGAVGLLPEPQVSSLKASCPTISVALDMNKLWQKEIDRDLPMGILVAKKDVIESRSEDIEKLLEMVAASVENVNSESDEVIQKIVDAGIVPDAGLCKAVIDDCSLTCLSAKDNMETLKAFYKKLYAIEPTSVGGALPGEDLYYGVE